MGIFSKKYDYEIDGIKYEFDLAQDRYCFFKDGKIIEDKNMNLRSRRFLKSKNDMSEEQKDQNREIAQSVEKMKEEKEKTKKAIENRKANGIDLKYSSADVLNFRTISMQSLPAVSGNFAGQGKIYTAPSF